MSDSPSRGTWSLSPWWGLLLFPLALFIGWLAGQMPVPRRVAVNSVSSSGEESSELSEWTTIQNATAESQRTGKPILIDFNAEWCGPCQALKRQVFENEARGRLVQAVVVPVSIVDRRREDGDNPPDVEKLQQRYGVDAFPTLIVYSPATGRVQQARGFGGAEETVAWITQAAKSVR